VAGRGATVSVAAPSQIAVPLASNSLTRYPSAPGAEDHTSVSAAATAPAGATGRGDTVVVTETLRCSSPIAVRSLGGRSHTSTIAAAAAAAAAGIQKRR